jgi:hypothetical protein
MKLACKSFFFDQSYMKLACKSFFFDQSGSFIASGWAEP